MKLTNLGTLHVNDQVPLKVHFKSSSGTNYDISGATTLTMTIVRPNKSVISATAVFVTDGTDGQAQYQTVSGDLNAAGVYNYWVVYANTITGEQRTTGEGRFTVVQNA